MTTLKKRLTKLGAEIQTSGTVGSQVTALIATESAATKSPKKVGDALHFGVPVCDHCDMRGHKRPTVPARIAVLHGTLPLVLPLESRHG